MRHSHLERYMCIASFLQLDRQIYTPSSCSHPQSHLLKKDASMRCS